METKQEEKELKEMIMLPLTIDEFLLVMDGVTLISSLGTNIQSVVDVSIAIAMQHYKENGGMALAAPLVQRMIKLGDATSLNKD